MSDNLAQVLEIAEHGLPEGDYLRVANLLRDAHVGRPAAASSPIVVRTVLERKIKVSINKRGVKYSLELVCQTTTETRTGHSTTYNYLTTFRYDGIAGVQTFRMPFHAVVKEFMFLHKPREVILETALGNKTITYCAAEKHAMKMYEKLTTRYVEEFDQLPDTIREHLNDLRQNYIDFGYSDYVQFVVSSIPDTEGV